MQQLKDIDERLPRLSWKQNESSIPKMLSLIEMVQTRFLHERFLENCRLLDEIQSLMHSEIFDNQDLKEIQRELTSMK